MEEKPEQTEQNPQIDEKDKKIEELTGDVQRMRADFENYRKQTEAQRAQAMEIAKMGTVAKVLPLLDDIDRAIATYTEQLAPLAKSLEKTLKEMGLKKINSKAGTEFDPNLHEAVMFEEGDGEKEVISETLRPGYYYEDEVVRTAMVKVKR